MNDVGVVIIACIWGLWWGIFQPRFKIVTVFMFRVSLVMRICRKGFLYDNSLSRTVPGPMLLSVS